MHDGTSKLKGTRSTVIGSEDKISCQKKPHGGPAAARGQTKHRNPVGNDTGRYASIVTSAPPPNFGNRTMWTRDNRDVLRGLNSESIDHAVERSEPVP